MLADKDRILPISMDLKVLTLKPRKNAVTGRGPKKLLNVVKKALLKK